MRIFVTTGILLHDVSEEYYIFLNEVLKIVIEQNAGHDFIIHSHKADTGIILGANVTYVRMRNVLRHSLLVKMWYDFKLPAILKKYKADVFISFDGLCSMTTAIPQFIVFNDSLLLSNSAIGKGLRSSFYMRLMLKALQKAKTIVCCSDFRKQDLMLRYLVDANKLHVMYPVVKGAFHPLNEDVKEEVRMNYCDGKNYFIYTGAIRQRQELFSMLKGFSAFKKRQKSNWKLILTGNSHQYDTKFMKSLDTYKYRSDVIVATNVNEGERARLIGSAYAVICVAHSEIMIFPVLQALICGVAVITTNFPAVKEIAADGALYYDSADSESIASQLMNLYKDETFRKTLIEKGKVRAAKYSFDQSAQLFWKSISGTKVDFKSHGMD